MTRKENVGERLCQRGDCRSLAGQGGGLGPGGQKEALRPLTPHTDPHTSGQGSHWHPMLAGATWDALAHPHLPILQGFPDPQAESRASLRASQGTG